MPKGGSGAGKTTSSFQDREFLWLLQLERSEKVAKLFNSNYSSLEKLSQKSTQNDF